MIRYLLVLTLFAGFLFAQVEQSSVNPLLTRTFNLEFANYPTGIDNKTRVDFFIKIPYSNIQFVKTDNSYVGRYSVTITFYDEDEENVIFERFWNEKIISNSFNEAISPNNYNYSYKSFELEPNRYFIKCEVYDKDSKKNMVYEGFIGVYEYDDEIQISDLLFIDEIIQGQDGPQYIPKVSNQITGKDSTITFIYEVYSNESRKVDITYSIQDEDRDDLISEKTEYELKKGINNIEFVLGGITTKLGNYLLNVKIYDPEFGIEEEINKPIVSRIYGFPKSIVDLDLAIEQMSYIAGSSVVEEIEDGETFDEKLRRFKSYWKAKDPSPDTEYNEMLSEYYRRIAYANSNFKHYFDGWKTDMGMIYVVLGPPNNVERHPFDLQSKPYEVWDYYDINKRFVFVDQTGFGDYRLLNQQYGDWYRYRP
jgi:GWxTD domain-containing protein